MKLTTSVINAAAAQNHKTLSINTIQVMTLFRSIIIIIVVVVIIKLFKKKLNHCNAK